MALVRTRRPHTAVAVLKHIGFRAARPVIRHVPGSSVRLNTKRLLASALPEKAV